MKYLILGLLLVGCCDSSRNGRVQINAHQLQKTTDGNITCYKFDGYNGISCLRNDK